jgi:hypothetical protein
MSDESPPPRPAESEVVGEQLKHSLADLASRGDAYQGYLAQIVRTCFLAIQDGDLASPQVSLDRLAPALHLGERLVGSSDAIEAAAWVRATARFFAVAKEALAPRITLDTLLARDRSDTDREILEILLRADKIALRCGEIADRWPAARPRPTTQRIGQVLAGFHGVGLVVRMKQPARGGSDVAFYRLSRLGRELCERLHVPASVPTGLLDKDAFYANLQSALRVQTSEPLYLTTFEDLDGHRSAQAFHDEFLAMLAEIRRPIHWIFVRSRYFDEVFRPRIEASGATSVIALYPRTKPDRVEPTIQVLDGAGCIYPVAPRTALTTTWDVGRETWERHRAAATA